MFLFCAITEPVKTEIEKSRYDYGKDDSMDEDEQKLVIKEEGESHDEEELKHQNVSQASSCDYSMSQFKDEPNMKEEDDDSEEDMPLVNFRFFFNNSLDSLTLTLSQL